MNEGIFVAASGGMKQQRKLEVLSNNLANVNTPGFKKDQMAFEEVLPPFNKIMNSGVIQTGYSRSDITSNIASYVAISGFTTDFSQGVMTNTGNSFDLALEGEGFFAVGTEQGIRYTRIGNFTLDEQGQIVNKQGHHFLDITIVQYLFQPRPGN